jgi:hypothetical protein
MKIVKYIILIIAAFSVTIFLNASQYKPGIPKGDNPLKSDTLPINKKEKGINFLIVGDWGRSGDYNQYDVADQMNYYAHEYEAKFVISTGDNFYENGVRSVDDPQWMTSFENVYHGGALQRDWYVVLGNHDYKGSVQAEIDYTEKSRRWNMPARYYSITEKISKKDSALFVFYDSSPFINNYYKEGNQYNGVIGQDTIKQLYWMDSVLNHSKAQWKFVVGHHPIFSGSPKKESTTELLSIIKPMLETYHVQTYISGHVHALEHVRPEGEKIDYFISGAGSETENPGSNENILFYNPYPGFAFCNLTADSLKTFFISYRGVLLYQYSRAR